jgi:hypothetical protein
MDRQLKCVRRQDQIFDVRAANHRTVDAFIKEVDDLIIIILAFRPQHLLPDGIQRLSMAVPLVAGIHRRDCG